MDRFVCGIVFSLSTISIAQAQPDNGVTPKFNLSKGEKAAMRAGFVKMAGDSRYLVVPYGAYKIGSMWNFSKIRVCWSDPGVPSLTIRNVVRAAVADSWSQYVNVTFIGWEDCADTFAPDISLHVAKTMSVTTKLGKNLRDVDPGMLLRIDYSGVPECKAKEAANPNYCLRANTIHEFGHALGLVHENLRPDAPDWCKEYELKEDKDRNLPDGMIGVADKYSIMNHCNPSSLNNGYLSVGDIDTIKKLYGAMK
jgi:hypothetical protein